MLRPEELGLVVTKIKEVCPKAFKDGDGERAQILVDMFDLNSFKQVMATV